MSLARHHHIATDIDEIKKKRQDTKYEPDDKINFHTMVQQLWKEVDTKSEKKFVDKLLNRETPSRKDVSSIKSNEAFLNTMIVNMQKRIVFLYKDIDDVIDKYLVSSEDRFVLPDLLAPAYEPWKEEEAETD